jgi:hypothetical protein
MQREGNPVLKHARRATIALTTSVLVTTGLAAAPVAHAAPSDVKPRAAAAADWLAAQLEDGLITSEYQDLGTGEWTAYTDYGLTLDFFYAMDGLGVKRSVRRNILDAIEPQVESYTGSQYLNAGAMGKLLAAVQEQGIDPSTYAGGDLVADLEGLVHTAADSEQGRAKDTFDPDDEWAGDFSNTFGQSFVVRALTAADSDLAEETVDFLLKQQCAKGFFRVYMESSDHTCESGRSTGQSGPSVDATATGVRALLEARQAGVTGLGDDIRDAVAWLVAKQASDGSFKDEGVANSNSTGLAAEVLAELGRTRSAARAASWLASLRVTGKLARTTAFKRSDVGAVAFSKPALRDGKQDGITRDVVYQWRRATAQAAVGLDS